MDDESSESMEPMGEEKCHSRLNDWRDQCVREAQATHNCCRYLDLTGGDFKLFHLVSGEISSTAITPIAVLIYSTQLNSTENYGRRCLTPLSLHRNYILSYEQYHFMTSSDRFPDSGRPVPVRSAVKLH